MEKLITHADACQILDYDENGNLIAITNCGKTNGIKEEAYFNEELGFYASAEVVKHLLAERKQMTFLPVTQNLSVVTSDPQVSEITKSYEEKYQELFAKNTSLEKYINSCENKIDELNAIIDAYNDLPFWKRMFKKVKKFINDED